MGTSARGLGGRRRRRIGSPRLVSLFDKAPGPGGADNLNGPDARPEVDPVDISNGTRIATGQPVQRTTGRAADIAGQHLFREAPRRRSPITPGASSGAADRLISDRSTGEWC